MDYVIDACIGKEFPHWCLEHWLLYIIEYISCIKVEIANIFKKKMFEHIMNIGTAHMSSNLEKNPRLNEEIVGFENAIENLKHQLIKESRE